MAAGGGSREADRAGGSRTAARVPTLARPPEPVHPVPQQHGPGQLREGLGDVEVAQRADLEEGDTQALRVGLRLLRGHLPLEGQVQAVSHQDFRDTRGVLTGDREARGLLGRALVVAGTFGTWGK